MKNNMKRESRQVTVTYNPNVFSSTDEFEEDSLYENAAVCVAVEQTATSEKKILSIIKPFAPVAVCWVVLVVVLALRIHFTSVISTKLSDEVKASGDAYQNLKRRLSNLKVQIDTLRQTNSVLQSSITILTEENQLMKQENQTLWAEMQQMKQENQTLWAEMQQMKQENQTLSAEMEQIKKQMNQMKAEIKNLRAENQRLREYQCVNSTSMPGPTDSPYWIYSPSYGRKKRQTEPCQAGWLHFRSKCYLICSRDSPDQKTWQAARDDCREKDADLVAIQSPEEQDFIFSSAAGFGVDGFWISLRVEDGSWKWLNGSDLTENSWIQPPADNQNCAIAAKDTRGWRAESCDVRNEWVCQKDALPG